MKDATHKLLERAQRAIGSAVLLLDHGDLDPKFHRWLVDAFDKRIQADYDVDCAVTEEEVRRLIDQATEFLVEARRFITVPS